MYTYTITIYVNDTIRIYTTTILIQTFEKSFKTITDLIEFINMKPAIHNFIQNAIVYFELDESAIATCALGFALSYISLLLK